ncbi:MAG: glycosyltransferase family 39 protein [Candidatus Saccharibacteria bacterium]
MQFLLLPILLLGGYLRFYNNTAVALWHDEAFSALYIAKYGWAEMMHRIILDVHPPLYYIVLRLWAYIFGHSILSLRGMSILFGLLTIWAGYLFISRAFRNRGYALLGALLIAVNPFQIQYALEVRMYTFGTFLALISSYLLIKAFEDKKAVTWILYGITVSAMAYTHYFLFFTIAAQGLYALYYLIREHRSGLFAAKDTYLMIGSYLLSLLLYIPWIPSLMQQIGRVEGSYWIPAPDRWSIPGTIWKMAFGGQGINHPTLVIATVVTVILAIYLLVKMTQPAKWLVFLGLVVPFLASLLLSYKTAIYLDRYFVFASLYFSILAALSLVSIPGRAIRRSLLAVFAIASVVIFFQNWKVLDVKDFGSSANKRPGMADASAIINEEAQPNDKIFVGSSFVFFTFQYYNHTPIRPLLLSSGSIETIPHFSGTAILSADDLQLTQDGLVPPSAVKKSDKIWLLWTTGWGGSKPNVPGNWRKIQEREFPDTPGFKGSDYVTEYQVN